MNDDLHEYDYDDYDPAFWEEEEEDDPWYPISCPTPGCLMMDGHFRSECFTAYDAARDEWHSYGCAIPWRLREPVYTARLYWSAIRYRDDVSQDEWYHHLHCEIIPRLRYAFRLNILWPNRCMDCGRRWQKCPSTCLPF